ncbi:MAG: hypothetical protein J6X84_00400 [Treponema sp.]|nr:hypothetical protein [Treponema sp.]
MKKFCIIYFLIFLTFCTFAQSAANKKSKLPSKKEFKSQYDLFLENERYSDHWTQKWDYEKSKETVAQELKDFDSYLSAQKPNYEIELLDLIVKSYLYNLDEIEHQKVIDYGNSLKEKYPKEYRTWWVMGRFYAGSTPNLVFPEFETACKMRGGVAKKDEWTPAFLWDYIYGCNMADMKIHAREGLHYYCEYTKTKPEDYFLYSVIYSNKSVSSVNQKYDLYDTWFIDENESETRLFSTLLGVSIPVHGDWNVKATGYENGRNFIAIRSDPMNITEDLRTTVTFSIMAFTNIDRNELERIANSSMTRNNGTISNKKTVSLNGVIANRYVYENPTFYSDERKGMKGITLTFSVPYNEFSGLSLERPVDFSKRKSNGKTEDGLEYISMKPKLNRLESNIYFVVSLDACNACFDEAEAWFNSLVENAIFE